MPPSNAALFALALLLALLFGIAFESYLLALFLLLALLVGLALVSYFRWFQTRPQRTRPRQIPTPVVVKTKENDDVEVKEGPVDDQIVLGEEDHQQPNEDQTTQSLNFSAFGVELSPGVEQELIGLVSASTQQTSLLQQLAPAPHPISSIRLTIARGNEGDDLNTFIFTNIDKESHVCNQVYEIPSSAHGDTIVRKKHLSIKLSEIISLIPEDIAMELRGIKAILDYQIAAASQPSQPAFSAAVDSKTAKPTSSYRNTKFMIENVFANHSTVVEYSTAENDWHRLIVSR
jgi:hypothetical protein